MYRLCSLPYLPEDLGSYELNVIWKYLICFLMILSRCAIPLIIKRGKKSCFQQHFLLNVIEGYFIKVKDKENVC